MDALRVQLGQGGRDRHFAATDPAAWTASPVSKGASDGEVEGEGSPSKGCRRPMRGQYDATYHVSKGSVRSPPLSTVLL